VAYVIGTISDATLGQGLVVKGAVSLNSDTGGAEYAYPYRLTLSCTDPGKSCDLGAELDEDGTLHLTLPAEAAGYPLSLSPGGAAVCNGP
jgi:hypothetical protein